MPNSRLDLVRWQFDLTWSLFEIHLEQLEQEDFFWRPAAHCWTMHRSPDGGWHPDFDETEPDPVPVPTIAWLTWHIGWWWTVTIDHCTGHEPHHRAGIEWPGPGQPTVSWLRNLRQQWIGVLDHLTEAQLAARAPFPWRDDPDKTIAHAVAWVNFELAKNVSELGQLRLLRAAEG